MQQTTNYNLNKFDSTDELESATRVGLNENADTIDTALKGIQDDIDGLDASEVSYDNTVSGLTATDVQAALDEELDKIDILSNYLGTVETEQIQLAGFQAKSDLMKWGKIVVFSNMANVTSMVAGDAGTLATLPEGWRPAANVLAWGQKGNALSNIQLGFKTDGVIDAYNYNSAISSAYACRVFAFWVTP